MVKYQARSLDAVFSALGDPTRRAILARLARGESTVSELAAPHEMSLPAVSKHLRVLEAAGLLRKVKEGRIIRCRMDPAPLKQAAAWIEEHQRFWDVQMESLASYLEGLQTQPGRKPTKPKKEG